VGRGYLKTSATLYLISNLIYGMEGKNDINTGLKKEISGSTGSL